MSQPPAKKQKTKDTIYNGEDDENLEIVVETSDGTVHFVVKKWVMNMMSATYRDSGGDTIEIKNYTPGQVREWLQTFHPARMTLPSPITMENAVDIMPIHFEWKVLTQLAEFQKMLSTAKNISRPVLEMVMTPNSQFANCESHVREIYDSGGIDMADYDLIPHQWMAETIHNLQIQLNAQRAAKTVRVTRPLR